MKQISFESYQKLTPEKILFLVVDVQEKLFVHVKQKDTLRKRIQQLLQGCQLLNIPVLFTEQYPKGLGRTIAPLQEISAAPVHVVEKTSFSCCKEGAFTKQIEQFAKSHIVVGGMETHVCVQQTAMDLYASGYKVTIAADAVSSRTLFHKNTALRFMSQHGIHINSVESILFELAGYSDIPIFKELLSIIKNN